MRFLNALVLLAAGTASAASSWGFDDATVTVGSKKANTAATGPTFKEKYVCPLLHRDKPDYQIRGRGGVRRVDPPTRTVHVCGLEHHHENAHSYIYTNDTHSFC